MRQLYLCVIMIRLDKGQVLRRAGAGGCEPRSCDEVRIPQSAQVAQAVVAQQRDDCVARPQT